MRLFNLKTILLLIPISLTSLHFWVIMEEQARSRMLPVVRLEKLQFLILTIYRVKDFSILIYKLSLIKASKVVLVHK